MRNIIFLLALINSLSIISQEMKFISAINGLIVREAPNKNSKRVDKLNYGTGIYVIQKTGIKISVNDDGKQLDGQWVEINKPKGNKKGYVFDGYLTSSVLNKGKETENYYLTKIDSLAQKRYWYEISNSIKPKPTIIYLRNKQNEDLVEFSISELEFYDGTTIIESDITDLSNITKLITIESTYNACCSNTEEYNYLLDSNNSLIKLPEINNDHCDGPEPYYTYIFPNDNKGEKEKIIYAKVIPDKEGTIDTINVLKTFELNNSELNIIN